MEAQVERVWLRYRAVATDRVDTYMRPSTRRTVSVALAFTPIGGGGKPPAGRGLTLAEGCTPNVVICWPSNDSIVPVHSDSSMYVAASDCTIVAALSPHFGEHLQQQRQAAIAQADIQEGSYNARGAAQQRAAGGHAERAQPAGHLGRRQGQGGVGHPQRTEEPALSSWCCTPSTLTRPPGT